MKFHEYLRDVVEYKKYGDRIRTGQAYFNVLHEHRPDLSERVRGNYDLDPFYDNDKIPAFMVFIAENW